jgi:hypothetical protein
LSLSSAIAARFGSEVCRMSNDEELSGTKAPLLRDGRKAAAKARWSALSPEEKEKRRERMRELGKEILARKKGSV